MAGELSAKLVDSAIKVVLSLSFLVVQGCKKDAPSHSELAGNRGGQQSPTSEIEADIQNAVDQYAIAVLYAAKIIQSNNLAPKVSGECTAQGEIAKCSAKVAGSATVRKVEGPSALRLFHFLKGQGAGCSAAGATRTGSFKIRCSLAKCSVACEKSCPDGQCLVGGQCTFCGPPPRDCDAGQCLVAGRCLFCGGPPQGQNCRPGQCLVGDRCVFCGPAPCPDGQCIGPGGQCIFCGNPGGADQQRCPQGTCLVNENCVFCGGP